MNETLETTKIGSLAELLTALAKVILESVVFEHCELYRVGDPEHDGRLDYDYIFTEETEIRENEDGTFTVKDTHTLVEFSCTGEQVVDYFSGKSGAWDNNFDCQQPDSYYNKGFRAEIQGILDLENDYRKKALSEDIIQMRDKESSKALLQLCVDVDQRIGGKITIVEVGSYRGESSAIFAEYFSFGKIFCVDPWLPGYDAADSASQSDFLKVEADFDFNVQKFNNVTKVKKPSLEAQITCDVVYIDGVHTYEAVRADLLHWLPQTKRVICGHDFHTSPEFLHEWPHLAGVSKAVLEIIGTPDKVYPDGSWLKFI